MPDLNKKPVFSIEKPKPIFRVDSPKPMFSLADNVKTDLVQQYGFPLPTDMIESAVPATTQVPAIQSSVFEPKEGRLEPYPRGSLYPDWMVKGKEMLAGLPEALFPSPEEDIGKLPLKERSIETARSGPRALASIPSFLVELATEPIHTIAEMPQWALTTLETISGATQQEAFGTKRWEEMGMPDYRDRLAREWPNVLFLADIMSGGRVSEPIRTGVKKGFKKLGEIGKEKPKLEIPELPEVERPLPVEPKTEIPVEAPKRIKEAGEPARVETPEFAEMPKAKPTFGLTLKEPWEMTSNELLKKWKSERIVPFEFDVAAIKEYHYRSIQQALSEGKPVSPEVLKDYPDLAKMPKVAPKTEGIKIGDRIEDVSRLIEAEVTGEGSIKNVEGWKIKILTGHEKGQISFIPKDQVGRVIPKIEKMEVKPEPKTEPEVIGLNKAEIARIREIPGLEKLPEAEKKTWARTLKEAKEQGKDKNALETADEVLKSKRQITDVEHAGLIKKAAELMDEYDLSIKTISDLNKKGNTGGAQLERTRSEAVMDNLDKLTEATKYGRREVARALQIGRMMLKREDYSIASVTQRARTIKEGKLTEKDLALLEKTTERVKQVEIELNKIELKFEQTLKNQEKIIAERVAKFIAEKSKRTAKTAKTIENILIERKQIKDDLSKIGMRVNEITGVSAEASYLIGKLAVNYIREGATKLDQVVKNVLKDVPEITESDVYRAMNAKDPKRQAVLRSDVTKRKQTLKTEARLLTEIEDIQQGIFKPKIKRPVQEEGIRRLKIKLRALQSETYRSGINPARLERALRTINELQDQLANQYHTIRKRKPVETAELKSFKEKIANLREDIRLDDALADLNEQLRTGDFKIDETVKPARKIPPELERKRIEHKRAKNKVRTSIEFLAPVTPKKVIVETVDFLRTMKATADMSGVLRQGLMLIVAKPTAFPKSFTKSFKAFFDNYTADQIDMSLRSVDHHYIRVKSGLQLTELGRSLGIKEEYFRSRLAERIPGWGEVVKASERHMVSFLNMMRCAVFDDFLMKYPNATHAELTAWADWVNVCSGRGNLKEAGSMANTLSLYFFAPRFALSRIQTPFKLLQYWKEPRVRKEIAKDMAKFVGTGTAALALADLAGFEVGTDVREPDFGKMRIGDSRIDVWAGFQQPARLVTRIGMFATDRAGLTGKHLTDIQKDFKPIEAISRFAAFKLAPSVTLPRNLLVGETMVGEKLTPLRFAASALAPMVYEDVYDAFVDGGISRSAMTTGITFFGTGVNTYADSEWKVRRDIQKAKHAGNYELSRKLMIEWNMKHPDRKISMKFLMKKLPTGE